MKIITWNVNSVHARLPRITALLARHQPDLLCLQEIKTSTDAFPAAEFAAAGYEAAVCGQAGRNELKLAWLDAFQASLTDRLSSESPRTSRPWPRCRGWRRSTSTSPGLTCRRQRRSSGPRPCWAPRGSRSCWPAAELPGRARQVRCGASPSSLACRWRPHSTPRACFPMTTPTPSARSGSCGATTST